MESMPESLLNVVLMDDATLVDTFLASSDDDGGD